MIPPGFLHDLLARTDIVEVVGRHVELKRGGANYMGLCPFHAEKSPSFSVSPSKQFYYCFGCGASGDAIRFLVEHAGYGFLDAVNDLASRVGMTVPQERVSPEEQQRREQQRERKLVLGELLERAAGFWREQLKASPRAIDYLKGRGLSGAVAARFGLGYAPPGWRTLAGVFPRYDDPLLEEAGLVRRREPGDGARGQAGAGGHAMQEAPEAQEAQSGNERGRYDWFRDRVMFPIRSVQGEVIGFGGRVLDGSKPKYINSPETPLFSKGQELYGLFEARQALRERGFVLVVEGYMDVVALAQAGLPNAVATLGTACTADHVHKLFRHTDQVVFAFDGDAAGRRAAARALEAALPHAGDTRSVRFLFLPPEHDPDSYVRELGLAAFERELEQAVPLSRQLLAQAAEGIALDSAEGRARMLAQARPLWGALPDGALRRQLLPELAHLARLEPAELAALWAVAPAGAGGAAAAPRAGLESFAGGASAPSRAPAPPGPGRDQRRGTRRAPAAPADLALRLLFRHSAWWERLSGEDHQLLHDLGGEHGDALAWLEGRLHDDGPLPWSALQQAAQGLDWAASLARWVGGESGDDTASFEDLQRVLHQLWIERHKAESALLAAGNPGSDELQRLRWLHQQMALHKAALSSTAGPQA